MENVPVMQEELAVYQYKAYTIDKRIVEGKINASSEKIAEESLYQAGYNRILVLREVAPAFTFERLLPSILGIKRQDIVDFLRQLAILMESGMLIVTALQLLGEQVPNAALKRTISGLNQGLLGGISFANALAKYPQLFSDIYCHVIRASEQAGELPTGLRLVADYMEKEAVSSKKLGRILSYPTFLLIMSLVVIILLATVAMPSLLRLFTSLGIDLPWTTRLLMTTAGFLIDYKFYLLGGFMILIISGVVYFRSTVGKRVMDILTLRLPVLGHIIILHNICRFCRTSSMLLKAGLTLPQTLNKVIGTIDNWIIKQTLMEVQQDLSQGKGLSQPMAKSTLFPKLLIDMVFVGEKTGTLPSTFATMAEFYEHRLDQKVQGLLSLIEPASIIIIGIIISFIGIAMFTPLYSMLRAFQ